MMAWLTGTAKMALKTTMIGSGLLLICAAVNAQQSMSVQELENFILKKKSELSEAIEQRDETLDKRAELEKKRAEQAERQEAIEQELRTLCEERDAAEPGSLDDCLAELNISPQ